MTPPHPIFTLFPYTTLFRSCNYLECMDSGILRMMMEFQLLFPNKKITTSMIDQWCGNIVSTRTMNRVRSEEHTSELQSRGHLVCRLLLEKKKNENNERLVVI